MESLRGKVAVITGAASGIGRAVARRFAAEGMRVVLADIEETALAATERELAAQGAEVLAVRTDVSRWEDVAALADAAFARFGAVHVLHNNAGVVVGGPVETLALDDWEWVLRVDLWSVIYGVKAFVPRMKLQAEGHVVNTASTAGLMAAPAIGPYNVAKFGVVALSETLARELALARSPLGVSVLCPGAVNTRITESTRNRPAESSAAHQTSREEEAFLDGAKRLLAQGMDPAHVAECVVEAIHSRRFWILTHTDWPGVLTKRVEALARDGSLAGGFGG
jgi:NAD(P)-dependent dehydrogenase (short-subunit alcohol dehydrogenase family)